MPQKNIHLDEDEDSYVRRNIPNLSAFVRSAIRHSMNETPEHIAKRIEAKEREVDDLRARLREREAMMMKAPSQGPAPPGPRQSARQTYRDPPPLEPRKRPNKARASKVRAERDRKLADGTITETREEGS